MEDKDTAQQNLKGLSVHGGQVYRHYKGGLYVVITVALKEDTLEPLVVYRSVHKQTIWIRTYENFTSHLDTPSLDGYPIKRFVELT